MPGPFIRTNDYPRITFDVLSPVFAPPDGALAGFNGDYSGLTIPKGVDAHPIWSDKRGMPIRSRLRTASCTTRHLYR